MKKPTVASLALYLTFACQTPSVRPIEVAESNKVKLQKQFENLQLGQFEAAWNGFKDLRLKKLNPVEIDLIEAGEARTYFLFGESERAIAALRLLLERDATLPESLRRQVRFYLADALDEVGNLNGALASLKEILTLNATQEEALISHIRQVDLLIKLNGSPAEIGKLKSESESLYQEWVAEDPNPEVYSRLLFESSWSAPSYFREENYGHTMILSQKWNQQWKARALQTQDNKWAQVTLRNLQLNLKELWNMSINPKLPSKMDPKSAERARRNLSNKRLNSMLEIIQFLELEFLVPFPNPEHPRESQLAEFLDALKSLTQKEIILNQEENLKPERAGKVTQDIWNNIAPLPEPNL